MTRRLMTLPIDNEFRKTCGILLRGSIQDISDRLAIYPEHLNHLEMGDHGQQIVLLHYAATAEKIAYLVDQGADINQPDEAGNTLLHFATFTANEELVQVLMNLGADLQCSNHQGQIPQQLATNLRISQQFNGSLDISVFTPYQQRLGIIRATSEREMEVVRTLLQSGTDIRLLEGKTYQIEFHPFVTAARNGDMEMIKLFIDYGADVDVIRHYQRTALQEAIQMEHHQLVSFLLQQGADPNFHHPLKLAVEKNDLSLADELLSYGADPEILVKRSRFSLAKTSEIPLVNEAKPQMVQKLLKAKKTWNPNHLFAALIESINQKKIQIMEQLIDFGAPLNSDAILHHVIDSDNPSHFKECLQVLMSRGYKLTKYLNAPSEDGEWASPLHHAVTNRSREKVQFLLANGADQEQKNILGFTPYLLARSQSNFLTDPNALTSLFKTNEKTLPTFIPISEVAEIALDATQTGLVQINGFVSPISNWRIYNYNHLDIPFFRLLRALQFPIEGVYTGMCWDSVAASEEEDEEEPEPWRYTVVYQIGFHPKDPRCFVMELNCLIDGLTPLTNSIHARFPEEMGEKIDFSIFHLNQRKEKPRIFPVTEVMHSWTEDYYRMVIADLQRLSSRTNI